MKIELNANESQVLLNLIDIAVKSVGIQAAEAGLHFTKIIKTASEAESASVAEPVQEAA